MSNMSKKRGRPKLLNPKKQTRLNVTYLELVQELKAKLAPPGLELTDAQTFDIAVCTLHKLMVGPRSIVCDLDQMMTTLNVHFKLAFNEALVSALEAFGHKDAKVQWSDNGHVAVTCEGLAAVVPARLLGWERLDKAEILRELRPTGKVT